MGKFNFGNWLEQWGITYFQLVLTAFFLLFFLVGRIVLHQKELAVERWTDEAWQKQTELLRRKIAQLDSIQTGSRNADRSGRVPEEGKAEQVVDLNSATQSQLESLPGIGPALARRILDWRKKNNGFERIEDLKKIKGIGKKKFEKIVPFITLKKK